MMGAKTIGCINHPGVEAIGRCRQCGKPVCKQCGIAGVQGFYCSEICQEKHEKFVQRAAKLEPEKGYKPGIGFRLRQLLGLLITVAAILCVLGMVSYLTYIPLLTDVTTRVLSVLGF